MTTPGSEGPYTACRLCQYPVRLAELVNGKCAPCRSYVASPGIEGDSMRSSREEDGENFYPGAVERVQMHERRVMEHYQAHQEDAEGRSVRRWLRRHAASLAHPLCETG